MVGYFIKQGNVATPSAWVVLNTETAPIRETAPNSLSLSLSLSLSYFTFIHELLFCTSPLLLLRL